VSRGLICDQCGTALEVNDRGEAEGGEEAGWIRIETQWGNFDCCTRSCVVALVEEEWFVEASEHQQQIIAEIAATIRSASEQDDEET